MGSMAAPEEEVVEDLKAEGVPKECVVYSEEQKKFALTLHTYGPEAYQYLKDTGFHLPAPETLQSWLASSDAKPGINIPILEAIKIRSEVDRVYKRSCLMIDTMKISEREWFPGQGDTTVGFVDTGMGDEPQSGQAKEALVIMMVGVSGPWKAPIAYFLTKGLTVDAQAELVKSTIYTVDKMGLIIEAITMDGAAANKSMCNKLGCRLTPPDLLTHFTMPGIGRSIYIFMDACHMLKLARNMLCTYDTIKGPDGNISWDYIRLPFTVEEDACMRSTSKLGVKHLKWQQLKRKVSLEAQSLSKSVAYALQLLRDSKMPGFEDCLPTIKFIMRLDRLFDILNTTSPIGKAQKEPLSGKNWEATKTFLQETKTYLLSLETTSGVPLYKTTVGGHMSILGFIICIESLCGVVPRLLKVQKYVLTYKFSQDHLQPFFNAARRCGGWNNSSAKQFQDIFRLFLNKCGMSHGFCGNVFAQGQTALLAPSANLHSDGKQLAESTADTPEPFHSVSNPPSLLNVYLNPFILNVCAYLAGWVVRKAMRQLDCNICREALVMDTPYGHPEYHLLELKNSGGLVAPSTGVMQTVSAAERSLRPHTRELDSVGSVVKKAKMTSNVLLELGSVDIFALKDHILETSECIDNHHTKLLRHLVHIYFEMWNLALAQRHNFRVHQSWSSRANLT